MKRHIRLLILFFALSLAVFEPGCFSGATVPAPIVEIPSAVNFPESVGIDVSQAVGSRSGSAVRNVSQFKLQAITDFSSIISLGPLLFNTFNVLLDQFLAPLSDLEIAVSPSVTNFEGPMSFASDVVVLAKIDFSDFDLDGDGVGEGCTGCTCPAGCAPALSECPPAIPLENLAPICYRIWIRDVGQKEFVRFSAGRIDRYATRDNPDTPVDEQNAGNGSFRLGVTTEESGKVTPLQFGVYYEHRVDQDPVGRKTDFFVEDQNIDKETGMSSLDQVHAFVTQSKPTVAQTGQSLQKLVKLDFRTSPDPIELPAITQYIGGFLDDFDFWSGTFNLQDTEGTTPPLTGENVCALFSTGGETSRQNCLDLGIDVGGETFIRPADSNDVAFPADFPESPTF